MGKKRVMHRLVACLLAIVMILGAVPYTAEAKRNSSSDKLYALEITTGAVGADISSIQSIVINYKSNGKHRSYTENLNENSHHLEGNYGVLQSSTYSSLDFAMDVHNEKEIASGGTDEADGVASIKWKEEYGKRFIPYETQTVFFKPYDDIDSVESIQIVTAGSGSWEVQGMRLIDVDMTDETGIDVTRISKTSTVYSISCSGTRLTEMSGTLSMQWGKSSLYTVKAKASKTDCYLQNGKDAYQSYDSENDDYWLQIKIADEYMAGLESVDLADQTACAAELLSATFYYKDIYGDTRVAQIPILSSLLAEAGDLAGSIKALAQQGNTLMVSCKLPGFSELITDAKNANSGIKISWSYPMTVSDCYLNAESDASKLTDGDITKTIVTRANNMKDQLSLTDIAMYKAADVNVTPEASGAELSFNVSAKDNGSAVPEYYYSYKSSSGRPIEYGESQTFTMQDNRTEKKVISMDRTQDVSNLYLVEIDTANVANAASSGDLSVSFTYTTYGAVVNENGVEQTGGTTTSSVYSVKDEVKEYYGYWPAVVTSSADSPETEDYPYQLGMQANGKLLFLVNLANVDTFQSVTLTLNDGKEWQVSNIKISSVTGLKHRSVTLGNASVSVADGSMIAVNHTIAREATSVELASSSQQVLFRAGETKTITFGNSSSTIDGSDTPEALDPNVEEMTYEEACKSRGYNLSRVSYDVDVTVAGASGSDATNGDSGSKNLFYFRLNFENGSSAYVLANQQLSSDGFRAGQTERFSIAMNQSYGELVSVDIIPDDSSSNSDIYDKLNISSIRVTRNNNSAVSRAWEVTSPGWVGVDYKEEGSTKNTGRYEGEITRNYRVDKASYSVKLLFAIATDAYDEGDQQFSGTIQATLRYTDSSSQSHEMTFDLIERIYNYIDISPTRGSSEQSLCTADTSCMFRGGTSDRFYLDLPDVQSVESMKLSIRDENGTTWKIKSVGVSQVRSSKTLYLDNKNEYVYSGETDPLTQLETQTVPAYKVTTAKGSQTDINMNFEPNTISITTDASGSADSTITRKPSGTDDTLNIFVKSKQTGSQQLSNYDVKTTFSYVNAYGKYFNNATNYMQVGNEYYYTLGVSTPNFTQLKQMKVSATAKSGTAALYGDGIILQHIRGGTLLGTYRVDNENKNLTVPEYSDQITEVKNQETQAVTLHFGDATTKQALTDAGKNVAVSIGFKSSLGNNDITYHSPYVYLTDEQYDLLTKNMTAEIDFHIPYVKEITDIRVGGLNDVTAYVESATVGTYTNDNSENITKPSASASSDDWTQYNESIKKAQESRTLTGWYSFSMNAQLGNEAQTFTPTNINTNETGALVPVTLTLTAQDTSMSSDMDLAVSISYLSDQNGSVEQVKTIPSVKQWIDDSSTFVAGGSISLSFMLSDVSTITGVTVRTLKDGTVYPLDKVVVEWNQYGAVKTSSKSVMSTIDSQSYPISLVDGTFRVTATSTKADGSAGMTLPTETMQEMNFALTQGDSLAVTALYSSSVAGDQMTYELYKKESSGAVSPVSGAISVIGNVYTVTTTNLEDGDYELHFNGQKSKAETVVKFTLKSSKQTVVQDTGQIGSGTTGASTAGNSSGAATVPETGNGVTVPDNSETTGTENSTEE